MMVDSLWGDEFTIENEKERTRRIVNKVKKEKVTKSIVSLTAEKIVKSKSIGIDEKLNVVKDKVYSTLHKQLDSVIVIRDRETLRNYLAKGIELGRIAIDTETNNSLDPITCKLMGLCLYVKGEKQAYIPINHINKDTKERLEPQLTESDIHDELQWLIDNKGNTKFIFHNGKFDYQVLKQTCGVRVPIDWDTMIGARLLDENEKTVGLKAQYVGKIDPEQSKYDIEGLFEKLPYEIVDPDLFALYAATDAMMTDRLYEWQMDRFKDPGLSNVLNLANTVEMPVIIPIAEMELNGVSIDSNYQKLLSTKYHRLLADVDNEISKELDKLRLQIMEWRQSEDANKRIIGRGGKEGKSKGEQLEESINLSSPTQLAILLYDVLGSPQISDKSPRGTGSDILEKMPFPICRLLIKRKELEKLITGFIDALPTYVDVDGRIHCHFNQCGAATGRTSSSDPNLQQIPSHNKEIRMIFRASPGYILVGADYSQQEPRLLASFADDENMIDAYKGGKDLYAMIASGVYHNNYEDNLEHYPNGTTNFEGKKRRSNCKSILLGLLYGRGAASIAEQIGESYEEAQSIIDRFYKSFPKVKKWMDGSIEFAKKNGYITDLWGRRRRLPDILLPRYEVKDLSEKPENTFNPILICSNRVMDNRKVDYYRHLLDKARNRREVESIRKTALKEGVEIKDNGGFISQAERQCVNARIQGSAATMTKKAMIAVTNDSELNRLGFRLMINVHDELIGECPEQYSTECAKRLEDVMKGVAKDKAKVPFKCDADISYNWYFTDYRAGIKSEYEEYRQVDHMGEREAFNRCLKNHIELTEENMKEVIFRDFEKENDESWKTRVLN